MRRQLYALFFNVYMIFSLGFFKSSFDTDEFWVKVLYIMPLSAGFMFLGLTLWDTKKRIAKLEEADSTPTIRK